MTNLDTLSREMADLARAHQLGEKDIRERLERIHQDCTPETCECYRAGLTACVMHRCVSHRAVPRQNMSETGGAECGACILIEGDHEWALWAEKWTATIDTYSSLLAKAEARLEPMQARIAELGRERDEAREQYRKLAVAVNDDLSCDDKPNNTCDSYGHDEDCPGISSAITLMKYHGDLTAAQARNAALEKALRETTAALSDVLSIMRRLAPGTPLNNHTHTSLGIRANEAVIASEALLAESESASQPPLRQFDGRRPNWSEGELIMRRLLWSLHATVGDGHHQYGDDGELQCSGKDGGCDFLRATPGEIEAHIHARGLRSLAESSLPELIQHAFVACYHGVGLCVTNPGPDGCHHGEPYCGQPRERHIQGQQSEREE